MSHNILKLNSAAFDVNSNKSESITDPQFYYIRVASTLITYPTTPSTSADFLIERGAVITNPASLSWLTENNHPTFTSYLQSVTFTQDGVYRVVAGASLKSVQNSGGQGYNIYNKTTSSIISNSYYTNYNELEYMPSKIMHTIVTRSGSDVEISIRPFYLNNVSTATNSDYGETHLYIEKLQ
jgi:hypothetical protein